MAIGSAVQQGKFVCVYNEKGVMLFGKLGTLLGYTGSSVTVRQGNFDITYNERGQQQFSKLCS